MVSWLPVAPAVPDVAPAFAAGFVEPPTEPATFELVPDAAVLLPVSATAVPVVVALAFWSFVLVGGGVVVSLAGVSIVAGASVAGGSLGAGSAGAGSLAAGGGSVAGAGSAGASEAGGLGGVDSATESGVEGAGSSAYARPPRTTTEERHTADPTNSRIR